MKKWGYGIATLALIMGFSGCASKPGELQTAYVSPAKYKNFDCDQIALESDELTRRLTQLYTQLDTKATRDQWQMGVGLVLFWPALFALEGGDGQDAAEYSGLKGEMEAVRTASIQKKCDIDLSDKTPEAIAKKVSNQKQKEAEENQQNDLPSNES